MPKSTQPEEKPEGTQKRVIHYIRRSEDSFGWDLIRATLVGNLVEKEVRVHGPDMKKIVVSKALLAMLEQD